MINEVVIGTIILLVAVLALVFWPMVLLVGLGTICFGLIAYMIGAAIRECMPGYRGI
jgi:hypothetical protein